MMRSNWRGLSLAVLLSSALAAACGDGTGGPSEGTLTLSGGVTGTSSELVCSAATLNSGGTTYVCNAAISGAATIAFELSLETTGNIANGTYDLNSSQLVIGSISQGGSSTWQVEGGSQSGGTTIGSASLTITGTGTAVNSSAGSNYFGIHGSFTATFKQQQGGNTDITATGTF